MPSLPPHIESAAPLVVRFGALGDMVLLTPLLHLLHRRYGQPGRVLGSGAWLTPLYAGNSDIDEIMSLRSRRRPYWLDRTQQKLVAALRVRPPGPVYVCDDYATGKIRWLLTRAGVSPEQCVYAYPDCLLGGEEHWIDRWLRFGATTPPAFASRAQPVHAEDMQPAPRLYVDNADRDDLDAWLQRHELAEKALILLQPGNKRTLKRGRAGQLGDEKLWPLERWAALIRALLTREADARVVLCGAPPEQAMLRTIARTAGSDRVRAVGDDLPLRRLLALCERASGMISVDTGPAHAAAALGCPLLVMFGNGRPAQWLPRSPSGSAVIALGGWPHSALVADITLPQVLAAWDALPLREPHQGTSR
ncbi:MAG: glycosyltransferase family 9 protein [Rhodanobacteraceae bacterium]